MIERSTDAARIAFLSVETEHPLSLHDVGEFVSDARNICLVSEHGAAMFQWTGPKIYGGHIMMLNTGRGQHALKVGRQMLGYMRGHGARLIWANVELDNRPARWFVRKLGFVSLGIEDGREQFWLEVANG